MEIEKQWKHWRWKIARYGTVALIMGAVAWTNDIGPKAIEALGRLPVLESTVHAQGLTDKNMLLELKEAEAERKQQSREIAALLAEMRLVLRDMETSQTDIKRLLER